MKIYTAKNFPGVAVSRTAAICSGKDKDEALDNLNAELAKRSLGPLQLKDLHEFDEGARLLQDGRVK